MGGTLGNRLDDTDRLFAAQTAQLALESVPSGIPTAWRNPKNGHAGTVTPTRTYQSENGRYCREYQQVEFAAIRTLALVAARSRSRRRPVGALRRARAQPHLDRSLSRPRSGAGSSHPCLAITRGPVLRGGR